MTDHLDIDAHGRVAPADERARRALADRAGRFQLLPSVPDLLVARRSPVAGGAAPAERCVLAGDLAAFPLVDLIALVHQSRLRGLLTVAAEGVDRAVAFQDGQVRGARSQAPGERIGEVALRLGFITPGQLADAEGAPPPFGRSLVERGLLTPAALWKCLHEQVAAIFHAVLVLREGVFALVQQPDLDLGIPLAVDTQALLMDGIRRIDEMTLFRARITGPDAFLRQRKPRVTVTLKAPERAVLDLVDGRRTVEEIAREAHLNAFDATKLLYHLAEAGYVEPVADPLAPVHGGPEARGDALLAALDAVLGRIAEEVRAAGALDPFLAAVRTYLADPSSPLAALWRGLAPRPDGTLDLAQLKRNVRAGDASAEVRRGAAALRELVLFYLFLAGERLPRQADDRLNADVKRRLEALGELR